MKSHLFRKFSLLLFFGGYLVWQFTVLCQAEEKDLQDPVVTSFDIEKGISIVQSIEKKYKIFRWAVNRKISPDNYEGYNTEVAVLYDLVQNRFCIKCKSIDPWIKDGKMAATIARHYECSFNGSYYVCWERAKEGTELPSEEDHGTATISNSELDNDMFQNFKKYSYIHSFGLPNFFHDINELSSEPDLLSHWLQKWNDSHKIEKIVQQQNDKLVFYIKKTPNNENDHGCIIISYNISQGVIEKAEWGPRYHVISDRIVIEYKKSSDEKLTPQRFIKSRPAYNELVKNPRLLMQDEIYELYTDFEINPNIAESDFTITIPKGIYVDDHIKKMYYRVGDALEEEAAVDKFMLLHNLKQPDEVTGKRARDTEFDMPERSSSKTRAVLVVCGMLLIILGILIKAKRKRNDNSEQAKNDLK